MVAAATNEVSEFPTIGLRRWGGESNDLESVFVQTGWVPISSMRSKFKKMIALKNHAWILR
jgi:hypothetical protein